MNSDANQASNILPVQNISEQEKDKIMKEIETKTEKMILEATRSKKICDPLDIICGEKPKKDSIQKSMNILENIMQSGADEFEKKVGRKMTYSEMRAMYG